MNDKKLWTLEYNEEAAKKQLACWHYNDGSKEENTNGWATICLFLEDQIEEVHRFTLIVEFLQMTNNKTFGKEDVLVLAFALLVFKDDDVDKLENLIKELKNAGSKIKMEEDADGELPWFVGYCEGKWHIVSKDDDKDTE